jgi:hypothetical protein
VKKFNYFNELCFLIGFERYLSIEKVPIPSPLQETVYFRGFRVMDRLWQNYPGVGPTEDLEKISSS